MKKGLPMPSPRPAASSARHGLARRPLALMVSALLLAGAISGVAQVHAFAPIINLGSLNDGNGFRLDGVAAGDRSGFSVSAAGDVNGDGIDDLVVGASGASPNGSASGSSYVVFGRSTGFAATLALSSLNGSDGFRLDGAVANDQSGHSVSAVGDINGDGLDDLIVGAWRANPNGNDSGSSYVVFGRSTSFAATLALSSLNGTTGFRIDGVAAGDYAGVSVSAAGDINGDGIDDLIVGASRASPNGSSSGSSYVVFGKRTPFAATLAQSSLDGSNGFRIDGVAMNDRSGHSVSAAGDINGDGIDDLIVGAYGAFPNGNVFAGSSFVVFGQSTGFAATLALSSLNGGNGFRLDGLGGNISGRSVSAAGDINGDDIDDLIVGAEGAFNTAGRSYVVFGKRTGFAATQTLSSVNGSNGFSLQGVAANEASGGSVSAAGDISGDGIDDLIIGAANASPNGGNSGSSYVVFGTNTGFPSNTVLSSLNGNNGFRLNGVAADDRAGRSVRGAGDINGDGINDVIVGAYLADPNGSSSGSSYVVFGPSRLFSDGLEAQNIVVFHPRLEVRNGATGSAVRWQNGATCNCNFAPFDFNLYQVGGNLAYSWPVGGVNGAVASGADYSVLQAGAVIGPSSNFITTSSSGATAAWRAGVDGYLGFRFVNAGGVVNYGYARIRTTAPTGYPVEVVDFSVSIDGMPLTIPMP